MKISKLISHSLVCLSILLFAGIAALADTIRLKDGSVLKGKVVSYNQRKFTIIVNIAGSTSQHVVPVEDVESVEFDSTDIAARGSNPNEGSNGSLVPVSPPASRADQPPTDSSAAQTTRTVKDPDPAENRQPETDPGTAGAIVAEKTVSVASAADWTSTEIRIQRGQRIIISASGEVELGDGRHSGPEGINSADNRKLIPNRPTGALIAVVGDDNDDFIYVGVSGEFVAPHSGILFLSVNEGNLRDNTGAFVARVKVFGGR